MKAVVFVRHGGPEVLSYSSASVPKISADEVLLRIQATALNYTDIWARRGVPGMEFSFPHIGGSDAAGIVEQVGSNIRTVRVGESVLVHGIFTCRTCIVCMSGRPMYCPDAKVWGFQTGPLDGAQAEYGKVPASNILPKPDHLTWEESASLPTVLFTAWRMLVTRANIRPGNFVLVWGAAGGLGCMAVQICRVFGAQVIAVASNQDKLNLAQDLGAEFVINRKTQRVLREVRKITNREGVDVVFDHVGLETWQTSVLALKRGGTIVTCGATTGRRVQVDLRSLWNKQQNYLGSHGGSRAELLEALQFVNRRQIKPIVMDSLPIQKVAKGHQMLEENKAMGKIVLVP